MASMVSELSPASSQTDLLDNATNEDTEENTEVVAPGGVYTCRWYILLVFGSLACLQGALCVVWPVTAESCEAAFGWTNSDLSLFSLWIYLTYIVGIGPFMWLMQKKGPVLFTGSPLVSAAWFPPDQRSTATAIGTVFGVAGTAMVFVIDPYVVPSPIKASTININQASPNFTNIPEMKQSLMYLRYSEFSVSAVLLFMTLIYFPAKPPNAPSISAATDPLSFLNGVRQIFSPQKMNFWYVALPSGISAGIFGVYNGLLDVNVKDIGVAQTTAGWMNFYSTIGSCIAGLILGRLGDKCIGHRKLILILMAVGAALAAFVVVLIVGQYIPFNIYALYVSYIAAGLAVNGALPLYFETAIETTFPISEGVAMGVMTLSYNIFPVTFLLILTIPNIGTLWMNWCMYGALVISVPLLLLYRERYDRLSLDNSNLKTN